MTHCYLSKLHVLTLLSIPGIGRKTVQNFLQTLTFSPSNIRELREALLESKNAGFELDILTKNTLEERQRDAEKLLRDHEKAQVKVIAYSEPEFPQQLHIIPDPPAILYVKGNIDCLKPEQSVAVIGTRNPSEYGRERANKIAQIFAEKGLIVVSGLAEGCDTAGHEGCLKANGCTVAVLAHGLQMIYPAQNKKLAERIVDSGGCLVSEYHLGTKPFKSSFVERDRLQSGLSAAVVVIETDIKGGTMHTARYCLEQDRTLACIDHPPERRSEKSRGNQKLIAEKKAIPLKTPEQLESFIAKVFRKLTVPQITQEPVLAETPTSDTELTSLNAAPPDILLAKADIETIETESTAIAIPARELVKAEKYLVSSTAKVELPLLASAIPEVAQTQVQSSSSETELIIRETVLAREENEKVIFEVFLNKDEVQRFEAKCKQSNKTTSQTVAELIRQDLYSISQKNKKLPQDTRIEKSTPKATQLKLPNIETLVKSNIPDNGLTQRQLAERLKVNQETIRKNRKKGTEHFKKWSRDKDPDCHPWEYSETNRRYEVAF
jgi:DNA processing protein